VYLAGCHQPADDFAYLASGRKWSEEELDLFHSRGDNRLQIDGGKYRNCSDLRSGSALSDCALEADAEQLPLGGLPLGSNHGDDAKLLPKLGDGANDSRFRDFTTEGLFELRNGEFVGLEQLVNVDGELGNLTRASQLRASAPIAISPESVHVGQNPSGHDEVGLLAGLSLEVQAYGNSFILKTNEEFFGVDDGLRIGSSFRLPGNRFYKRRGN